MRQACTHILATSPDAGDGTAPADFDAFGRLTGFDAVREFDPRRAMDEKDLIKGWRRTGPYRNREEAKT